MGAEVVAISPQSAEKNAEVKARHGLAFPVLRDAGNAYARQLGIVFALPQDLRKVYEGFGIDLPAHNGDASWELPMPTRLVLDPGGRVRAVEAHPDYTRRPEPETALQAVAAIAGT